MTILGFPAELRPQEKRCAVLPVNVKAYKLLGATVNVQAGIGVHIHLSDEEYTAAGAEIVASRSELLANADIVLSLHKLSADDLSHIKPNALIVSYLDPFSEKEFVTCLCDNNITSISMEMIPRISRCQKMDALSSQASLAGYVMVMQAVSQLDSVLPMMMTPAGTLKPAKVFVIGAGVAGLQAIATAKRLGASVTAFDTRSVVAEQVQSLGAKFLDIDLGKTGETGQGYAQALTPQQMQIQQREQAKCIADSDIVITTAQLFGRKPPMLIDAQTIATMKPGSVIVDMAAQSGGNVQGSVASQVVVQTGVSIIGTGNWANGVAKHATQMYANNVQSLISEFWSPEDNHFLIDVEDEVQSGCIITHQGLVTNSMIKNFYATSSSSSPNSNSNSNSNSKQTNPGEKA